MSESSKALRHIVIVGRSVAAYMSAACLSRALAGLSCRISVLEWGTAEARSGPSVLSLPPLRGFHALLGLNDAQVAGFAGAMPCLGTLIEGFGLPAGPKDFVLGFGETGHGFSGVGFRHVFGAQASDIRFEAYNLAALAARAGRFAWPRPEGGTVMSSFTYGLNIDLDAYCAGLRHFAVANGVSVLNGRGRPEVRLTDDGRIGAIICGDQRLEGDFYIDATGPQSLLLRQALGVGFRRALGLKADHLLAARSGLSSDKPPWQPIDHIEACRGGFFSRLGLASGQALNLIYEGAVMDDDEARLRFEAHYGIPPVITFSFLQGRVEEAWAANCVAVGSAASVLETLCASGLHSIQVSLTRLLSLFPEREDQPHLREEYNRLIAQHFDRQYDFALMPYAVHNPEGAWPESLKRRLEQFKSRGRVVLYDEDTFLEEDWCQMFMGLGFYPERVDPRVYSLDQSELAAALADMRRKLDGAVQSMPLMADLMKGARQ